MFECQGNRAIYQMHRKRELFQPKIWCLNNVKFLKKYLQLTKNNDPETMFFKNMNGTKKEKY